MSSTNFIALESRWPKLYEFASAAENYAYTDPHSAIVKLRCFAEQLVGVLYRELNLPCEKSASFFDRLSSPVFIELIDSDVLAKLHVLRIKGNNAAHASSVSNTHALMLVREAYFIGQWIYKTYSGAVGGDYPEYAEPINAQNTLVELTDLKEQLAAQLDAAMAELAQVAAAEKAAQEKAAELQLSLDEVRLQAFKEASTQAVSSFNLEPENILQLITIQDVFSQYNLTNDQLELVKRLEQFLLSKDSQCFLLKGYAGTGKTFITKGLTEYFKSIGRNYVLAAPTGKASKVIAKKTVSPAYTIHKTIYSFKDIAEYRDTNLEGTETYKFYAQLAVNLMPADTLYIVDEASMVSDVYQEEEFFRFGSGFILRDFFKYVNLDHNDHRKKVILIGDNAQLPPVGMNFSPALDANYLKKEHNVSATEFELKEVVRQKADSGVMQNSIALRKSIHQNIFNQLTVDLNFSDIHRVEHEDLMDRYIESCGNKINGESIVIAHSNADVAAYNRRVREHFFPGCAEICTGDKVMAITNSNASGLFISNGDFGLVRAVTGETEQRLIKLKRKNKDTNVLEEISVTLRFRGVTIGFKDLEDKPFFFNVKIMEDLLYNEHPNLTSDESKALYIDFCMRNPNLKRGSLEFKDTLRADPYFNAMRIKFGYAITCHKAQGSEWNNVFVKCLSHQNQLTASYFRWFYTAITRTAKTLYLLDPPNLKLGGGIKSVSNAGINIPLPIVRPIVESPFNTASPLTGEQFFDIPESATFLRSLLQRVRDLVGVDRISVVDIIHNQYQEAYFFQREDETARVNIGYNGKEKVVAINSPQLTELGAQIELILAPIKLGSIAFKSEDSSVEAVSFSKEFLNEFHKKVISASVQRNMSVSSVTEAQWSLRYTFTRNTDVAVYDVWFNGRSQFTKCAPVIPMCTNGALVADVDKLLTADMAL